MAPRGLNPVQVENLAPLHHRQVAWRMEQFCAQAGVPRNALPFDNEKPGPSSGDCYIWVCEALCKHVLGETASLSLPGAVASALCSGAPARWFALAHQWFEGLQFGLPLQRHDVAPDVLAQAIAMSRQWRVQAASPFDHFHAHQWPVTCLGLQGHPVLHDALSSVVLPSQCVQSLVCECDALGLQPWLTEAGVIQTAAVLGGSLPRDPWQISAHPVVATLRWGCVSSVGLQVMHQSELIDVRQGECVFYAQSPGLDEAILLAEVAPRWQDPRNPPHVGAGFAKASLTMGWGWGDVLRKQHADRFFVDVKGEVLLQAAAWVWHGEWQLDDLRVQFRLQPCTDMRWKIEDSVQLSPEQLSSQPVLWTWQAEVPLTLAMACPVEVGQPVLAPLGNPSGTLQVRCALVYKASQGRLAVQLSVDVSDLHVEWATHSPCGLLGNHKACWSTAKPLWRFEVDRG
ncbi:MAG TPA: hypothetical protein VFV39_08815 [Limnobacter sp.]|nr:hypothetical protein [Limnobacter sp.]